MPKRVTIDPEILADATDMMQGDKEAAINWLNAPLEVLGNLSPVDYIATRDSGREEVRDLIGRIRQGVYS
jgi:putative toxin-antitoxin system antitoxin component (TIGR02293 family)